MKGKGRRENKERKIRKKIDMKKRERKERRKERRRGIRTNVAQGAEPNRIGPGTVLREVGFLLLWLFYT